MRTAQSTPEAFNLFSELTLNAHNRPALSTLVAQDSFRNGESGKRGITIADTAIDDGSAIMASERKGIFRYDGTTLSRSYPNFKYSADHLTTDI
ncbi:hypothetical protein QEH56_15045 [Pelagicoccus enzymogenes]|uniref:hypothetical protein n=1 Tax=Pelagicoccus enzymogenes TaxID=2773457 RepID=UPI00280CC548|nr:hypothetical protein [Pelagicoccus enzymogenes]MDQ8199481.1 hypothetical protein [Pelagicoccus enzymogenes]